METGGEMKTVQNLPVEARGRRWRAWGFAPHTLGSPQATIAVSSPVLAHVYQALASASFLLEIRLYKVSHQRSPVNHICFRHSKFSLLVPFDLSEKKRKQPRYSAVKNFTRSNSRPRDLPSMFPRRLVPPALHLRPRKKGDLSTCSRRDAQIIKIFKIEQNSNACRTADRSWPISRAPIVHSLDLRAA